MVIENFAMLPEKEQREFAEKLLKTINSEHLFIDEAELILEDVIADELSGDLDIVVTTSKSLEVEREGDWTASANTRDEDDYEENIHATPDYYDVNFPEDVEDEVLKCFKSTEQTIEGYAVSLAIDYVDEGDIESVTEVTHVSSEDAGIGSYEFWGRSGYDSQPYLAVTGRLLCECTPIAILSVSPNVDTVPDTKE